MTKSISLGFLVANILCSNSVFAAKPTTKLSSEDDKTSYSIGVDIGRSFNKQQLTINLEPFMQGIKDGQVDKPTLMTSEQIQENLMSLQTRMIQKQQEQAKKMAVENKSEGDQFLSENKKRNEIKTTASGLQYRVMKQGKGVSPTADDTVTTHYRGRLIDGTEFDSSYSRGQPATFKVNGVIKGWTEALQMMKPGAKWELFVPSDLAYGEHGVGNIIGPNATLIFEVELLSVEKS